MYIYISIFLCVLLLISVYVIWNLYTKNSLYEDWILDIRNTLDEIKEEWRNIDTRQMFEKDDDVGVTFQEIDDLLKKINEKVVDE